MIPLDLSAEHPQKLAHTSPSLDAAPSSGACLQGMDVRAWSQLKNRDRTDSEACHWLDCLWRG